MAEAEMGASAGSSLEDLATRYGAAYPWLVAITVLSAFSTAVLTSSIVNVAVPDVMGAFGVGQDQVQFIATAFFATMTVSLLVSPWTVDKLGVQLTFSVSLVLFAVGALISTFSPNLPAIIFGRVVQGFASGVMQPLVMMALVQAFPPERRGLAMALFSLGIVCAHGVGPYMGGLTIDGLHWRFIFLLPLPVVFFAFVMGLLFLPSQVKGTNAPFDWLGFALLSVSIFCMMTVIANGQRDGWLSDSNLLTLLIFLATGAAFILTQIYGNSRMMELSLFRYIPFAAAITISLVYGLVNFSAIYLYPIFGQLVQEYTPSAAGFLILPGALFAVLILPFMGKLADRVPPQFGIGIGLCLFGISNIILSFSDISTMFWIVAFLIVLGRIGLAFMTPSMMSASLNKVPPDKIGEASAIVNFMMLFGGAIGINGLVVLLDRRTQFHGEALTATQTSANPATRELLDSVARVLGEEGFAEALRSPVALNYLGDMVHAQANTLGFQDGFVAIAIVSFLGLIPVAILHFSARRGRKA
tara:strand:- start:891 stop:2474 length:1584 start_codon:yes stop_codon:yes gene_type:complete